MQLFVFLAAMATAFLHVLASEDTLTGANFASWLKTHPIALVMFYSPKSSDSRKLMPLFDDFAEEAKEGASEVAVAKIDCTATDSHEICLTYVEEGFPSLTVFRDGRPWSIGDNPLDRKVAEGIMKTHLDDSPEHEAPLRKAIANLSFLLAQIKLEKEKGTRKEEPVSIDDLKGPSPVIDLTGVDFSAWLKRHPVALVMFYSSKKTNFRQVLQHYDFTSAFLKKKYPESMFGKVDCTGETSKICNQYADSGFPSYAVFKEGLIYKNDNEVFTTLVENIFKNAEVEIMAPVKKAIAHLIAVQIERKLGKDAMRWGEEL